MLFVSAPITVLLQRRDSDQDDWWLGERKGRKRERRDNKQEEGEEEEEVVELHFSKLSQRSTCLSVSGDDGGVCGWVGG